jgi:hypothetical protein
LQALEATPITSSPSGRGPMTSINRWTTRWRSAVR